MKPVIDVDAVVIAKSESKPSDCNLCLHFDGGYPVTEMATGKIGYVVWLDLDMADETIARMVVELARARKLLAK